MRPFTAFLALSAFPSLAPAAPAPEIPFEKIVKDYLAAQGLDQAAPEQVSVENLLSKRYVHARLGLFEVYFPAAALDKRAEDLKECAVALLDAQGKWLDWLKPSGPDPKAVRDDLKAVTAWAKNLRVPVLQKARDAGGKELTAIAAAPDGAVEAGKRLAEALGKGVALGPAREEPVKVRLLLAPTRKHFVELACLVGWLWPEQRQAYWTPGMPDWSQCFIDDLQVIALEYPVYGRPADEWVKGVGMNEDDPNLMQQQVVQLAMNSLFERHYADRVPTLFVQGLSMNLVIDQFGQIGTRVDGDMRSRLASAREVFVPGVASDGSLPKNSAESRWREDKGRDRFMRVLHLAQREGEGLDKKQKNKAAAFAVRSDKGGDLAPVSAPFLGSAAAALELPAQEFQGDFAEMMRGYKCAFIWWLQGKAAGAEKASREKFASLLIRLSDPRLEGGFEALFGEVYDKTPLSGPEADKETLEGRFLIWLSHQSK